MAANFYASTLRALFIESEEGEVFFWQIHIFGGFGSR
jgi:hypothetical protein